MTEKELKPYLSEMEPCPICRQYLNMNLYEDEDVFDGGKDIWGEGHGHLFVIKCWDCNIIKYSDLFDCDLELDERLKVLRGMIAEWNKWRRPDTQSRQIFSAAEAALIVGALKIEKGRIEDRIIHAECWREPGIAELQAERERYEKLLKKIRAHT